jgi:hypothetical protein
MTGSSSYRFGVLARIVRHMRARHQEGDDHPLTIEEVLDETNQLDVGNKVKQVIHCFILRMSSMDYIIIDKHLQARLPSLPQTITKHHLFFLYSHNYLTQIKYL